MSEPTFLCSSCRQQKYVSLKLKGLNGRDICVRCNERVARMANADTIMVKNGSNTCTLAARRRGATNKAARQYRSGFVPPFAKT
jgi:hypothetical protein